MARTTKSTGGKPPRGKSTKKLGRGLRVNDDPPPLPHQAVAPVVLREPKAPPPPPAPKPRPLPNAPTREVVKPKVRFLANSEGSFIDQVQREVRRERRRKYASISFIVTAPLVVMFLVGWLF